MRVIEPTTTSVAGWREVVGIARKTGSTATGCVWPSREDRFHCHWVCVAETTRPVPLPLGVYGRDDKTGSTATGFMWPSQDRFHCHWVCVAETTRPVPLPLGVCGRDDLDSPPASHSFYRHTLLQTLYFSYVKTLSCNSPHCAHIHDPLSLQRPDKAQFHGDTIHSPKSSVL